MRDDFAPRPVAKPDATAIKGNAFIVYNLLHQTYELHTIEAYRLSGDSYNCSLDRMFLSQFLIWDYKATNFANHLNDILSIKELSNVTFDNIDELSKNITNFENYYNFGDWRSFGDYKIINKLINKIQYGRSFNFTVCLNYYFIVLLLKIIY